MKILLVPNLKKAKSYECTCEIIDFLIKKNCQCFMDSKFVKFKDYNGVILKPIDEIIKECDITVAIGGDGTIIQCAKYSIQSDTPIIGVNVGRLGFLASIESHEINKFKDIIEGNYTIEKRMLLELIILKEGQEKKYYALNDITVSKALVGKMVDLDITCEDKIVGRYRADGMIFSTPTGSTAYNLSAGGPIVDYTISCMLMTPICPHSLAKQTLIFSSERVLQVKPKFINDNVKVKIFVDGGEEVEVSKSDEIYIKKSELFVKLISFNDPFFVVLDEKIKTR